MTEPDDTTSEHHVIFRRVVTCGAKGCRERAHRWGRCAKCRTIVARCGAHDDRFMETVRAHC